MNHLGDYCYGTEILELPNACENIRFDRIELESMTQLPDTQTRVANISPETRYWFRWITGHQVMLILWTILVSKLREREGRISQDKLRTCTHLLQACSVIFEYTGSCSNDFYHRHVRPFMALYHRGFSGLWAADYRPIPRLIRQIAKADCPPELEEAHQRFLRAYQAHQQAHLDVAQRLVPEGVSLLKNSKKEYSANLSIQNHHFKLFDFFFLIERKPVTGNTLIESLDKRMAEIIEDMHNYPLAHSTLNPKPIHILQGVLPLIKQPQTIYDL